MLPQRLAGKDLFWWLTRLGLMRVIAESRPGRRLRARPDFIIGSNRRRLRAAGVRFRPAVADAEGRTGRFVDGTSLDASIVIWTTGYRPDHSWIHIPGVVGDGHVIHRRGVTDVPGLYFLGLPWQHSRGSALLGFVHEGAAYLTDRITSRAPTRQPAARPRYSWPPSAGPEPLGMLALLVPVITARPLCGPALGGVIGGRVAEGDNAGTCCRANVRSGGDLSPCPDRQPVRLTPGVIPGCGGRARAWDRRWPEVAVRESARLSLQERRAKGGQARERAPLSGHSGWRPAADRADPVALLEAQDLTREPDLVPVRHGRMMVSPFTFYRGAAKIMAADLGSMPAVGLGAQLCGDAHLSNFGVYASPERTLVFDLNDFDETLPGPFEYDVKRMAASFAIAGRNNGFSGADTRAATLASVTAYREAMAGFAQMRTLDIWYARLPEGELMNAVRGTVAEMAHEAKGKHGKKKARTAEKTAQRGEEMARKARTRDSLQALSKLGELAGGRYRIVSQPPVIVPARDLAATYGVSPDLIGQVIRDQLRAYRATLQLDRRRLLEHFEIVDMARKVVGVGSVGTRAFIVLLQGRDAEDPLFLQIKEATASVLEDHLPKSRFAQPGERVVQGQRMMQAVSDIFLGWTKGAEQGRYFYWRQLRDMKGSSDVESMRPAALAFYARMCGWTLARAHARSGDPVAIAAYLGGTDAFDQSVTGFSLAYADQNERDFEDFIKAIRSGRLEAVEGV